MWDTRGAMLWLAVVGCFPLPAPAVASCGWSWIDHRVSLNESGVWNPSVYRSVFWTLTAVQVGGAAWEGAESRIGKTMWQGVDSQLITVVTTQVMKDAFRRVRPSDPTANPCDWFVGGNYSFPSGEASSAAALVTPYILEYGNDHPWTYSLALLPLWIGAARVKNQAHWQSDVLVGWTIGGLSGWYAHSRETPLLVEILPHGAVVGLKTRF